MNPTGPSAVDAGLAGRLERLARITGAETRVVSVYLNTRWNDEQQRERVRVFLKGEIRAARETADGAVLAEDLDWIEEQGQLLTGQERFPGARGVAFFACRALGLREVFAVAVPFRPVFVVAASPLLTPLVAAVEGMRAVLVMFVDGERAHLIPLGPEGASEAVVLESEVPGRHRQGGWALLAQSHYQRHIQEHRGRHFEAVAQAVAKLAESRPVDRIVLAGEPRNAHALRTHLPASLDARVVGLVPGARYESDAALVERAVALLERVDAEAEAVQLAEVLTDAAKGGSAVVGLEGTLEAVARGAVHRLYIAADFALDGATCAVCRALQPGAARCRRCGGELRAVELGSAMVDRALATGGHVEVVARHPGLDAAGGVAARLRYAL